MKTSTIALLSTPLLLLALSACSTPSTGGGGNSGVDGSSASGGDVESGFSTTTSVDSGPCQYLDVDAASAAIGSATPFATINDSGGDTACGYFASDASSVVTVGLDDGLSYEEQVDLHREGASDIAGVGDRASCSTENYVLTTEFGSHVLWLGSAGTIELDCTQLSGLASAMIAAIG